jgi:hypothetical protein
MQQGAQGLQRLLLQARSWWQAICKQQTHNNLDMYSLC